MNFYDRLVKETEEARKTLYTVPQLVDGLKGEISRDTYIAYLTEAYHHVSHTVRFLMTMVRACRKAKNRCITRSRNISRKKSATRNGS